MAPPLHQPLTGIKTSRLRGCSSCTLTELWKGHPGALTPLQCPSSPASSRAAGMPLLSQPCPRCPQSHHLCDRGFLTYSGDDIQVQNIFTTFQSRWNLCKAMCTYYLSECLG